VRCFIAPGCSFSAGRHIQRFVQARSCQCESMAVFDHLTSPEFCSRRRYGTAAGFGKGKVMRFLVGLSIFQTVLLGLIGLRVMAVDASINSVAETSLDVLAATAQTAQRQTALQQAGQINRQTYRTAQTPVNGLSAEDIRQIIREEIASLATSNQYAAKSASGPSSSGPVANEASRHLKTSLQRDLDSYIARGAINNSEMANLQIKIAHLPAEDRGEILSRLTKALNSGEVDGLF
jgi:hypothetical protein